MAEPHSEADGFAEIEWLPEVVATLPRPLAHTYARLIAEAKLREPLAAAWALRDAWECAIRFVACLGLADIVRAEAQGEEFYNALGALFKNNGLGLGDWAFILSVGCDPAVAVRGERLLPGLTRLYRNASGRLTAFGMALSRSPDKGTSALDPGHVNVVTWRNKLFGHGVFRRQRAWYEEQTTLWIPPLHAFYKALDSALKGCVLRDGGADGPPLTGAGHGIAAGDHQHIPSETTEDVVLETPTGILGFGPLLSAQRCLICNERHIFFYDKSQRNKPGTVALRTELVDYLQGHHGVRKGWPPALAWEARLPKDHIWERATFDQRETETRAEAVFRSFAHEYIRPDWIMERIWQAIGSLACGYVHLEAPAGTGKSYLARALKEREGPERGAPVLLYNILSGARADYRTFITLLADAAKEQLDFRTQEMQAKNQGSAGLRQQFVEFLNVLMRANRVSRLIVVLDGLDELPARDEAGFAITDFLVRAADLPSGCVIVLTGRPSLHEGIGDHLSALRIESGDAYRKIVLDPADRDNRAMLARYALERLPEALRRTSVAEHIADRSRGVFLYAFHLVQALSSGAFASDDELPAADMFYGAYLVRLRERVGDALYEGVYRTLLLFLAAAQAPVTLDQLKRWGLREDHLRAALVDLADFVEEIRWRPWHERVDENDQRARYRIAHPDFVAFVENNDELRVLLQGAHTRIAEVIRNRHGKLWPNLDADNEEDVYDARFVDAHARRAGMQVWASTEHINLGDQLLRARRWLIADEIFWRCAASLQGLVADGGHGELAHLLGRALTGLGEARLALDRYDDAEASLRESAAIFRSLKGRGDTGQIGRDLGHALNGLGRALHDQRRLEEAEACYRENVVNDRGMVAKDHEYSRANLAVGLNNHASVLRELKRLDEAAVCQRESVGILHGLIENEGRTELLEVLATVLSCQGELFRALDRFSEAEICQSEAVGILRVLVGEGGRRELAGDLATALNNHGLALKDLNRLEQAEARQRECCAIRLDLVTQEGRIELTNDLAKALGNHGALLQDLKRFDEADGSWRAAVSILRHQMTEVGSNQIAQDLGGALNMHGLVLKALGRLDEAEACQRENATIFYRLVNDRARGELLNRLATAYYNHAGALRELGRLDEAEISQREAVKSYRRIADETDRRETWIDLAQALNEHGALLSAVDRLDEAEESLRECVALWRHLVAPSSSNEFPEDFALALENLGWVLFGLNRLEEAEACFRECSEICQEHLRAAEVIATRERWAGARVGLGRVRFATGHLALASRALSEGISVLKGKWERDQDEQALGELLAAMAPLADVHITARDWRAATADAEELAALLSRVSVRPDFGLKLAMIRGQAAAGSGNSREAIEHFEAGLCDVDKAISGGNAHLLQWRCAFAFRRASALFDAGDPQASEEIEASVDLWRTSFRKSAHTEADAEMLARSLMLRGRLRLKIGMNDAAAVDAGEARVLLTPLVDRHWRYRAPLADSLMLLAAVEERAGRHEIALARRADASQVLSEPS